VPARYEIVATFNRERHVFDNEDTGTRVIIGEGTIANEEEGDVSDDGKEVVLRGEAREGALKCGLMYRFYGRDVEHPRFGAQFAFTSFVLQEPAGKRAVTVYLQQCEGIGMVVASRLWDQYGDQAVKKLRTDPAAVAAEIKGLTLDRANAAADFLRDNHATERAKMDLLDLLIKRKFPKRTVDLLIDDYGSVAAERIRHNPYLLMRYRGCGFVLCDKLYMELKKPAGALKRQALCMWHGIAAAGRSSGDTWFSVNLARNRLSSEIAGADVNADRALELAVRARILETREASGSLWVAEQRRSNSEARIARYVTRLMDQPTEWPDLHALQPVLRGEDGCCHQHEQLLLATRGPLGILAGSPGTGKTYTVAALIRHLLDDGWPLEAIAVVAPTGKAAVRITETLDGMGVPIVARTIHSTLSVAYEQGGSWSFLFGDRCKLPFKWVFGDEWSMVDCDLNASFFAAIGEGTHVLLSGDTQQLPPVGHGAPLRDMIAAGIPTGTLTQIRRNSGQIVRCCHEIKTRKRFLSSAKLDVTAGENLVHVELDDADSQVAALTKLLGQIKSGEKYDVVWDVQVLCAVNKKSPLSRHELNKRLQKLLNPIGPPERGVFQVGDKIVNTRNGRLKSMRPVQDGADKDGAVYVANGEQGEVLAVEPNKMVVRLWSPDRTVIVPRGQQDEPEDGEEKAGDDEASEEAGNDKPPSTGCAWELGYAISAHKSQGSEWPIVIVLIDEHHSASRVQTSNWIYTAISRARDFCVTLGKRSVIQVMLRRDAMNRRTFLQERIQERLRKATPTAPTEDDWDFGDLCDGLFDDVDLLLAGVMAGGDVPF
jgi:exodeoxyribonuclease V alpha subunit